MRLLLAGSAVMIGAVAAFSLSGTEEQKDTSIAVIPFSNRSGDTAQAYLSDGLAEDLTARLARNLELRVAANGSTGRYRGSGAPPAEIAQALGVRHLLTGVMSRRGDSIRVSVELVDAKLGTQRWSEARVVPQRDLALLIDSIARAVSAKLLPGQTIAEGNRPTVSRDSLAYNYYLLGQHHFNQFNPVGLSRSMAYYDSVVARDPTFVGAFVGRAAVLIAMASGNGMMTGRDALVPLRAALDTIFVLDARSGAAHALRGHAYTWFEWDLDAAAREFRQALSLAPRDPTVHLRAHFLLALQGRTDSALALLKTAMQLDPTNIRPVTASAVSNFYGRRYAECVRWTHRGLELSPGFVPSMQYQGLCLSALGRHAEALDVTRRATAVTRQPLVLSTRAIVLAQADSGATARRLIDELLSISARTPVDPGLIFRPYAALNDRDRFFAVLERAIADRSYQVSYLHVDPVLDPVRDDPRFAQMVARTGIPAPVVSTRGR